MRKTKPVYYWDTCVLLALIKDEVRPEGEMAGVTAVVDEVVANRAILVTSAITHAEIQQADLTEDQRRFFQRVFDRSNVKLLDATTQISTLAGEIRHFYKSAGDGKPSVSFADALHLATALVYGVDEFHTFDGSDKRNGRGLLTMNGAVANRPLRIVVPGAVQRVLDLHRRKD